MRQEHWANQNQDHEIEKQEAEGGCRLVKVGHARSLSTMQPVEARGSVKRMLDADSANVSRSKARGTARPLKRKGRGKLTVVLVARARLRRSVAPHQHSPPCDEARCDSFVSFGRSCDLKFNSVDGLYQLGADFLATSSTSSQPRAAYLPTASSMDCRLCGQRNLGVKNWSPTQWRRRSTVANGHASCRQCRREVWDDPSKGYLVEQLHERLTFGRVHGDRLMELFEYWVDNLSTAYRKLLSHEGTVRSTDPIHPRRWWCTTETQRCCRLHGSAERKGLVLKASPTWVNFSS